MAARKRKTRAEQRAAERLATRLRRAAGGRSFCVVHAVGAITYEPGAFFVALVEAEAHRDAMLERERRAIPNDFHDREGLVVMITSWIEQLSGDSAWRRVDGSSREVVFGVEYPGDGLVRQEPAREDGPG